MKKLKIIMIAMLTTNLSFSQEFEDSPFGFLDPPPIYFDEYEDLEIKWLELARENTRFGWQSVEAEKGIYDFTDHDANLYDLFEKGINVFYITRPINSLYNTQWIEGDSVQTYEYPVDEADVEEYLSAWFNYFKTVVERYDGDGIDDAGTNPEIIIKKYQLVHEWNTFDTYWDRHRDQYAEVFEVTYNAMKEACEECELSMPIPIELEAGNDFLSEVLSLLVGKIPADADIGYDFHNWSMYEDLSAPQHWQTKGEDYIDRVAIINKIKEIAESNGFSSSNIISLESGMAATQEMEPLQAGYVIRSYVASLANGQKKQFWTKTVEYNYNENIIFAHTGLVHNPLNTDGLSHKKLGYYTYKLMIEKLEGSDWENIQTLIDSENNVYAYKFAKKETGEPVYVVWWDWFYDTDYEEGNTMIVDLAVGDVDSVIIIQAVPDAESGADLDENDFPDFFATESKQVVEGTVTITLGINPVFVEVISSTTSIEEATNLTVPKDFYLGQNYPNPFNTSTIIEYYLPQTGHVVLRILNMMGQEVRTLMDNNQSSGSFSVVWDGKNN